MGDDLIGVMGFRENAPRAAEHEAHPRTHYVEPVRGMPMVLSAGFRELSDEELKEWNHIFAVDRFHFGEHNPMGGELYYVDDGRVGGNYDLCFTSHPVRRGLAAGLDPQPLAQVQTYHIQRAATRRSALAQVPHEILRLTQAYQCVFSAQGNNSGNYYATTILHALPGVIKRTVKRWKDEQGREQFEELRGYWHPHPDGAGKAVWKEPAGLGENSK